MGKLRSGMGKVNAGVSKGAETLRYGDHDPSDHHSENRASPERELFLSVVLQAYQDAFSLKPTYASAGDQKDLIRAEARRWFVSPYEREDREFICHAAGLDPDWIMRLAKERIAAERDAEAAEKVIQIDKAFEILLRKAEGELSDEQVTAELERIAAMEAA